jgi:hypothetical protein
MPDDQPGVPQHIVELCQTIAGQVRQVADDTGRLVADPYSAYKTVEALRENLDGLADWLWCQDTKQPSGEGNTTDG